MFKMIYMEVSVCRWTLVKWCGLLLWQCKLTEANWKF